MTATVASRPFVPRRWHEGQDLFTNITPNWFATVMGTGIVAIAAAGLPVSVPALPAVAATFWVIAAALLITLLAATAVHWHRHPDRARRHHVHPVFAHFYGAVPMAVMTVGTGGVVAGRPVLGLRVAIDLDWALWTIGTLGGLVTMVGIPAVLRTCRVAGEPFPGWLMAVVPPVVSASAGAQLAAHSVGGVRDGMLTASYVLLTVGLAASARTVVPVVRQVLRHGLGAAVFVPTVWILLGPLGQSITAITALGRLAGSTGRAVGLLYSAVAAPLAVATTAVAVAVTARQVMRHLPFALTWWSFTFPVGTCVTAASGLSTITGSAALRAVAVALFAALVCAWCVVAARTARGVWTGELLAG